jgi:hypothetical protein
METPEICAAGTTRVEEPLEVDPGLPSLVEDKPLINPTTIETQSEALIAEDVPTWNNTFWGSSITSLVGSLKSQVRVNYSL